MLTSFQMRVETGKLIEELQKSLQNSTFVKLSLGNYKGPQEDLQRISVRLVETKKGTKLALHSRFSTRDIVKNFDNNEAFAIIAKHLENGFRSANLFTTANDFQLIVGKKSSRLTKCKASLQAGPSASHDRKKNYLVDQTVYYLKALGITTDGDRIRSDQRDKWRQINKFVEIVEGLIKNSPLKNKRDLRIVDMGSGKGYLTFALYDHLTQNHLRERVGSLQRPAQSNAEMKVQITGVEQRSELVALCNEIAEASEFGGLKFVQGTIVEFDPGEIDILIALHACDTATDDALFKAITANSTVIVVAPCCHHEVKKQLNPPDLLAGVLKHPVLLERAAETLTDGIRSLLLEANGYKTKMFEFVAAEHTPKNNMLVATRASSPQADKGRANKKTCEVISIMSEFGIRKQHLFDLLNQKYEIDDC